MSSAPDPTVTVFGAEGVKDLPGLEAVAGDLRLRFAASAGELERLIPDTEILLSWDFRADILEDIWPQAGELRWIHWSGAGVDAALFPGLRDSSVALTNARGVFDRPIAEYVLGLVLCMAKGFPRTVLAQQRRQWDFRLSESIAGRSALVVGAGNIGSAIGGMLRAAGMRVAGVGRSARDGDPVFGKVHAFDELDRLLGEVDYVINITPSTPATRGLFPAERFRRMKASARFINVGRGDAVDEPALVEALRQGAIAGAALDVFAEEPLPESSPLWEMDNVIVSPHMSGDVHESVPALVEQFVDNLRRYLDGQPLLNVVDKQRGY
ncbi:MAG TPA: D-2-hydroxyacid dehydrogenase [Arenicellales bacterium]|nr:D-2-hydroxyacid dehydrogenase [Arenicellales bacterium]